MMVVNSPEHGPNAQTAVFCMESFEDLPQTLIFKFLAGADLEISGKIGPMNFPSHSEAMIAIEESHLEWLNTKDALKVAKPLLSSDKATEAKKDTDENVETNQAQDEDQGKDFENEINAWEQCSAIVIPNVYFKLTTKSPISVDG